MKSLLIALLISGMMIKAEDGPFMEQSPSLEDYLEILVAQNPRIKGLEHQIEATQEQITAAKSLPDPTANVGLFLSEIETRLGPQRHKLSLKQTLPWKGKLALKGDVIQRQSQQIQAQRSLVIRELCADFKQNWASLYYLGKQIEKNEEHIDIEKELNIKIVAILHTQCIGIRSECNEEKVYDVDPGICVIDLINVFRLVCIGIPV